MSGRASVAPSEDEDIDDIARGLQPTAVPQEARRDFNDEDSPSDDDARITDYDEGAPSVDEAPSDEAPAIETPAEAEARAPL